MRTGPRPVQWPFRIALVLRASASLIRVSDFLRSPGPSCCRMAGYCGEEVLGDTMVAAPVLEIPFAVITTNGKSTWDLGTITFT